MYPIPTSFFHSQCSFPVVSEQFRNVLTLWMCHSYIQSLLTLLCLYVYALSRLWAAVQQVSSATPPKKWSDYVEDLWLEKNLKHLRDVAIPWEKEPPIFLFDPTTGLYGYQDGESEEFVFIQTETQTEAQVTSLSNAAQPLTSTSEEHASAPPPTQQETQMPEQKLPIAGEC